MTTPLSEVRGQIKFSGIGKKTAHSFTSRSSVRARWLFLLELLLTAGPMTYIALQLAYFVGFGKFAPNHIFFYFATFTVVLGICTYLYKRRVESAHQDEASGNKKNLLFVVNELSDSYLACRNIRLQGLNLAERQIEEHRIVLSNPFLSPELVRCIVFDITKDQEVASLVFRLIYNRNVGIERLGIHALEQKYSSLLEVLKSIDHIIYQNVLSLICGDSKSVQEGLERNVGFLERAVSAAKANNQAILHITDVQEVISLVVELICGRKFYYYEIWFDKKGKQREKIEIYNRELDKLCLTEISIINRFNSLQNYLVDDEVADLHVDDAALETEIAGLEKEIERYFDKVNNFLHKGQKNKRLSVQYLREVPIVYKLYKDLHTKLIQHKKVSAKLRKLRVQDQMLSSENHSESVSLLENEISLNSEQALDFVNDIAVYLDEEKPFSRIISKSVKLSEHDAKDLAFNLVSILQEHLNIFDPTILTALESSHGIPINSLEMNYSSTYKLGICQALTDEIKHNKRGAVIQTFKSLMCDYGYVLSEEVLESVREEYQINHEELNAMAKVARKQAVNNQEREFCLLPLKPKYADIVAKVKKNLG